MLLAIHVDVHDWGWSIAAALGTIVGALIAAASVITALVIAINGRRDAQLAIRKQIKRAERERKRELKLHLLVQLQEQVATYRAMGGSDPGRLAEARASGLLLALGMYKRLAVC